MTKDRLVTAPVGTTLDEAERILAQHRIEKLPVVDEQGMLRGSSRSRTSSSGASIPTPTRISTAGCASRRRWAARRKRCRAPRRCSTPGATCIVVDSAHGHSEGVLETVAALREAFPDVQLVAGNVAIEAGARALVERGVDAVKVGVGPGSICTTRVVTGVGVPQLTAIVDAVRGRRRRAGDRRRRHQVLGRRRQGARGRRRERDDGLDARRHRGEPRRVVPARRAPLQDDPRHGESVGDAGGLGRPVLPGRRDVAPRSSCPEGIEGRVPYKGPVADVLFQMVGGLRSGMGYCGVKDIAALRTETRVRAHHVRGTARVASARRRRSRAKRRTTACNA